MAEYFKREALIAELGNLMKDYLSECTFATDFAAGVVHEVWDKVIKNIPAADVVEVVRCGKCKHFRPYEGEEHKGDCAELVGLESCVYEDDFCSYGERRGDHE